MAVTTTPSTRSLITKLSADYPAITFEPGELCAWNPVERTILYTSNAGPDRVLHELGHALLDHESYNRDVELLRMEQAAWQRASEVASAYGIEISDDDIQDHLDSYRDWLHARSLCPGCGTNGVQSDSDHYRCIECDTQWRVNEARTCGLKRYVEHKNTP